jgi:hypothetical protein
LIVLSRRTFLSTALAGGAAAALAGCTASGGGSTEVAAAETTAPIYVPFVGVHQAGVTHPAASTG